MGTRADFAGAYELVSSVRARPVIDEVFRLADARAAHERMEAGKQFGMILLELILGGLKWLYGAEFGVADIATAASPTALVTSRTYPTVRNLLDELVNARVWIGFHFRNSVSAGENLGTSVANWELQRNFLPTNGKDG
jgi:glutathione S-transferase